MCSVSTRSRNHRPGSTLPFLETSLLIVTQLRSPGLDGICGSAIIIRVYGVPNFASRERTAYIQETRSGRISYQRHEYGRKADHVLIASSFAG